ncbi:kappa-type opioid receptor-like [Patiria miniata]|uniref:G-protein coupled receptors family 1 profile domain-containing protein n=1 Tax=Patiria miniata TaxID=46514 RepID=A0A913ZV12_PATMI|nr:kappa-type opioid receptor-like [Patiria miniata]
MSWNMNDTDAVCSQTFLVVKNATDLLSYTPAAQTTITVILPILLVFGVLNNIAFLFVVFRVRGMKTVTNACLANLAVADIIFLVTAIGQRLYVYCKSPIYADAAPIGLIGCELGNLTKSTTYLAALCSVTLVSMERYEGVCHPQRSHNRTGEKTYRWLLLASWFGALMVSATFIPSYLRYETVCMIWPEEYSHWPNTWSSCLPIEKWWTIYKHVAQTIPFIVSLFINVALYVNIVRGLNASVRRARLTSIKDKNVKLRNQIAWMLIVNGLVFFVLLGPYEILSLVKATVPIGSTGSTAVLEELFKCLSYVNSAINPVIYISMSSRYRAAFGLVFIPPFGKNKFRKANNASQNSAISSLLDICRDSQV